MSRGPQLVRVMPLNTPADEPSCAVDERAPPDAAPPRAHAPSAVEARARLGRTAVLPIHGARGAAGARVDIAAHGHDRAQQLCDNAEAQLR